MTESTSLHSRPSRCHSKTANELSSSAFKSPGLLGRQYEYSYPNLTDFRYSQTKDSDGETTPTEATTFASFINRLKQTPGPFPGPVPSHQSISSNYSSSVGTIYSNPHSSIGTLDYGFHYTRRAISQDSEAMAGWQWKQSESENYI